MACVYSNFSNHIILIKNFHRSSGNVKNASWSLYTYYRQLFSIKYTDQSTKVLLLYISPSEKESTDLQSSVKKLNINRQVYVGVLANNATFYKEMKEFENMCKN